MRVVAFIFLSLEVTLFAADGVLQNVSGTTAQPGTITIPRPVLLNGGGTNYILVLPSDTNNSPFTNINALIAGGATNQLQFTKGILTGVVLQ